MCLWLLFLKDWKAGNRPRTFYTGLTVLYIQQPCYTTTTTVFALFQETQSSKYLGEKLEKELLMLAESIRSVVQNEYNKDIIALLVTFI